jgi:hypothetical protein
VDVPLVRWQFIGSLVFRNCIRLQMYLVFYQISQA